MKTLLINAITVLIMCSDPFSYQDNLSQTDSVLLNSVNNADFETLNLSEIEQNVIAIVNNERASAGLCELTYNENLQQAAVIRAEEISKYFSHTRPNGEEWWTVDESNVYGENLAKGFSSAQGVFDAWMGSSLHKENILFPDFKTIGVARYETEDGRIYWCQLFGY